MSTGELTIVGTGIRLGAHVSAEALAAIRRAERVLYLVADPLTALWIAQQNSHAESLADCYAEGRPRRESYRMMVERILAPVRSGAIVCAAFYGHPGVGADPAHAAIRQARAEGFPARMLPAISADACLVADLGVDPLNGYQGYEASVFLFRQPRFEPRSALVLWQIGVIDEPSVRFSGEPNREGVRRLIDALTVHYPPDHEVVIYEAAAYPLCPPRIERVRLGELDRAAISPASTLYVPPLPI